MSTTNSTIGARARLVLVRRIDGIVEMARLLLNHVVDDVVDFRFQIGNPTTVVYNQGYDHTHEYYCHYETPGKAGVGCRRARMFTGSSNISRRAGVFPSYVIARRVGNRTSFLASVSKISIRTRFVTRGTGPATRAYTFTGDRITRRIVVTGAYFVTGFTVVA